MALRRQLSVVDLTLLGVGLILGAGIYALVGSAGVLAGPSLWLAFLAAGVIALFTGLSYAELAAMYPQAGSSYNYVRHAFRSESLAFVSGWLFTASAIVAATTVAFGFAQYVNALGVSSDLVLAAAFILVVGFALNATGIRAVSNANAVATVLEALGLVFVIALGFAFASPSLSVEMPQGFGGLFSAVALAFFAFLGFEAIANQAGEARNPKRDVPRALVIAIAVALVLYVLTALAFTALAPYDQILAFRDARVGALASAASLVGGPLVLLAISLIALFSTGNTVLVSLTMASRMLYGMGAQGALPKVLAATRNATPFNAVVFASAVALALLFAGQIEVVANATVMGMLVVFALDNYAVIRLRAREPRAPRPFRLPLNIANVPVTSLLGLFLCAALFAYTAATQLPSLAVLAGVIALGLVLSKLAPGSTPLRAN